MRTLRYCAAIALGTMWISCGDLAGAPPPLDVYIVSKEAKPGWRYFNSTAYPDLGYITDAPDLTVVRIESVERKDIKDIFNSTESPETDGNIKKTEKWIPRLLITFLPDDTKLLAELTSAHVSEHMLFMLGNEVIFAPIIREPTIAATISVQLSDETKAERVKADLEKLCAR